MEVGGPGAKRVVEGGGGRLRGSPCSQKMLLVVTGDEFLSSW